MAVLGSYGFGGPGSFDGRNLNFSKGEGGAAAPSSPPMFDLDPFDSEDALGSSTWTYCLVGIAAGVSGLDSLEADFCVPEAI